MNPTKIVILDHYLPIWHEANRIPAAIPSDYEQLGRLPSIRDLGLRVKLAVAGIQIIYPVDPLTSDNPRSAMLQKPAEVIRDLAVDALEIHKVSFGCLRIRNPNWAPCPEF